MREILFRGKRIDNGQWAYGHYTKSPSGKAYIHEWPCGEDSPKKVDEETVGQYTGLLDANGKKIFEGDVIQDECFDDLWGVEYTTAKFWGKCISENSMDVEIEVLFYPDGWYGDIEVVGNIFGGYEKHPPKEGKEKKFYWLFSK